MAPRSTQPSIGPERTQLGLNANTIATNLNVSLSSSEQVSPNFWTDPASGIPYYIAVQTPEPKVASVERPRQHARFPARFRPRAP